MSTENIAEICTAIMLILIVLAVYMSSEDDDS